MSRSEIMYSVRESGVRYFLCEYSSQNWRDFRNQLNLDADWLAVWLSRLRFEKFLPAHWPGRHVNKAKRSRESSEHYQISEIFLNHGKREPITREYPKGQKKIQETQHRRSAKIAHTCKLLSF